MSRILIVGSINMDLVVSTSQFPKPGETLSGQSFATHHGGKGANQAVAASRLGAQVSMLGCIGEDTFGSTLLAGLQQQGIDTRWVKIAPATASGIASITVCDAENAIIVVPGANHALRPEDIKRAEAAFIEADLVLAQLEIPMDTVLAAARMADRHGKPFLLNPAPAVVLSAELLALTTLLTPNEHELRICLNQTDAEWQTILQQSATRVVMTRGAAGASFVENGQLQQQSGFTVTPVDTTGAGDTFNAALATFWHLGLPEAVRRACAAGALSVTKPGAQGGMPTLAELETFLGAQS